MDLFKWNKYVNIQDSQAYLGLISNILRPPKQIPSFRRMCSIFFQIIWSSLEKLWITYVSETLLEFAYSKIPDGE